MTPLFPTTGDWQADRAAAVAWAREVLADPDARLLDTETTSLHDAEIVQLGILSVSGETLLDTLVKPGTPQGWCPIPPAATAIHGIRDFHVADAPTLDSLLPRLEELLHGRRVVVYNAAFDFDVLRGCLRRRWAEEAIREAEALCWPFPRNDHPGILRAQEWMNACRWECAMLAYSAFWGDWNSYRGSYTWKKLPSGDHSAIGDCKATLDIIRLMAAATIRGEEYRK